MQTLLISYLMAFVLTFWPGVALHRRQFADAREDAREVAALDTTPHRKLRMMNIAALESGFRRDAVGPAGEKGPWQVLGGRDFSAREALRRMEGQGMVAYCGCRHAEDRVVIQGSPTTCQALIDHRTEKADLYAMGFDPPRGPVAEATETALAGNP